MKNNIVKKFCRPFVVFGGLAVISLIVTVYINMRPSNASVAYIYSDGELIKKIELTECGFEEFDVKGKNTITIKDGRISVTKADCPDQICVSQGQRGVGCINSGPIVCMPNRLSIVVSGEDLDAVSR